MSCGGRRKMADGDGGAGLSLLFCKRLLVLGRAFMVWSVVAASVK